MFNLGLWLTFSALAQTKTFKGSLPDGGALSNGAAFGARFGDFWASNSQPATELFIKTSDNDFSGLEAAFNRWLGQTVLGGG